MLRRRAAAAAPPSLVTRTLAATFACWAVLAPAGAQITSELASPTFAEGNGASLGRGLDIEGDFAVLSAPSAREIHLYVRSTETGEWSEGINIDLSAYEVLGRPVALGDDLSIYYTVISDEAQQAWQLRRRTLGLAGGSDEAISSFMESQLPHSLHVSGDLMIFGWRPAIAVVDRGLENIAGFRGYQRVNGVWVAVIQETIQSSNVGSVSRIGWDTATDGTRFAVTDPLGGSEGTVDLYVQHTTGQWINEQTVAYSNLLQSDVGFGSAVAIDGSCLVVGMEYYNRGLLSPVADTGAAAIYSFDTSWTHRQTVTPDAALVGDRFGRSLALDGSHLLVASELAKRTNHIVMGDVSYWFRTGADCATGTWNEVLRLRSLPLVFDIDAEGAFGTSVDWSPQAGALVGDPAGPTGEGHGRGYVFEDLPPIFADGFESGDVAAWGDS